MTSPQIVFRMSARKNGFQLLTREFHKSTTVLFDKKWRLASASMEGPPSLLHRARNAHPHRLHKNPTSFGPLTNMPDYSFKDGRPTPFGIRQLVRINKNREYLEKMTKLSAEIDSAVQRHAEKEQEKLVEKQRIIDSKLKPKGHLLS